MSVKDLVVSSGISLIVCLAYAGLCAAMGITLPISTLGWTIIFLVGVVSAYKARTE